jgi:glycosyltransferase involved in cell wall biosynthesis
MLPTRPSTLDPRPSRSPLVTIAIPTYNRANSYLPQALRSACGQTYSNLDIVVADNCSSDDTEAIVRDFADSRVRYFRHPVNIGAHANFKFCLEQGRGDYFLLLQDDNLIDEDFIDVCMRAAHYRRDIGLIRTGMRWIDTNGKVFGEGWNLVGDLPLDEFFLGWFKGRTPMHLCSTLFCTKRLKGLGGFSSKHNLFDDVIAEIRIAARYERVDVPDVKASFRHHSNTLTASARISNWCDESKILLDLMCSLVPESKVGLMRDEGIRFFVGHNYRIAKKIRSPVMAYATILKQFNYPFSLFVSVVISSMFSQQVGYLKLGIRKVLEMTGLWLKVDAFRKNLQGSQR